MTKESSKLVSMQTQAFRLEIYLTGALLKLRNYIDIYTVYIENAYHLCRCFIQDCSSQTDSIDRRYFKRTNYAVFAVA